jgi:hypothetical protein
MHYFNQGGPLSLAFYVFCCLLGSFICRYVDRCVPTPEQTGRWGSPQVGGAAAMLVGVMLVILSTIRIGCSF